MQCVCSITIDNQCQKARRVSYENFARNVFEREGVIRVGIEKGGGRAGSMKRSVCVFGSKEKLHFEHVRGLESSRYYSRGKSRSSSNRGTASGARSSFFVITDDSVNRTLSVHARLQIHAREVSKAAAARHRFHPPPLWRKSPFAPLKNILASLRTDRASSLSIENFGWLSITWNYSPRMRKYIHSILLRYVVTYVRSRLIYLLHGGRTELFL